MVLGGIGTVLSAVGDFIVNIALPLWFAFALLVFLFGVFYYFVLGPTEEDLKDEGRHALLWGNMLFVVGIAAWFVMEGLYFIADVDIAVVDSAKVQTIPNAPTR